MSTDSYKIIYVQAHGGGSEKPDNKFITLNQYRRSIGNSKINTANKTPIIMRIVSPGKSALTDFDSDRANVNFLVDMLTKPEVRTHYLQLPNTRSFSGAYLDTFEGHRGLESY